MKRVQLEMSEEKEAVLKSLMQEAGVRTQKELFNNALTALEWMIKEKKAGNSIASVNAKENKWKELAMPILSNVESKIN